MAAIVAVALYPATVFTAQALWARYEPEKRPLIYHQGKYWYVGAQVPKE